MKPTHYSSWFLFGLLLQLFFPACSCSGGGGGGNPFPSVVSTVPPAGVAEVTISSATLVVSATFDREMDAATINGSTFLVDGPGGAIAGTVAYANKTATFVPNSDLSKLEAHTARVTTGAMDKNGKALKADYSWQFTTEDRKWQSDEIIDPNGFPASDPDLAFLSGGKAQAVWAQAFGTASPIDLIARRYTPATQSWGSTVILGNGSGFDVSHPRVAASGNDQGHIVWSQRVAGPQGAINAIFINGNTFLPPTRIDNATEPILEGPEVASGPVGFAFVAWIQQGAVAADHNVWANWYNPNPGFWTGAQVLDNLALHAQHVRVASNGDGKAIVAWTQNNDLYTNRFDLLGGGWLGAMLMENDAAPASSPEIAMEAGGDVILTWSQDDGTGQRIRVRHFDYGNGWSSPQSIDDGGGSGIGSRVAFGPAGSAFAIWTEETISTKKLFVSHFVPASGWEPAIKLAEPPGTIGVWNTALSVSPAGHALLLWSPVENSLFSDVVSFRYIAGKGWGPAAPVEDDPVTTKLGACAISSTENALAIFLSDPVTLDVSVNRFE